MAGGRPKKWQSPEQVQQLIDAYFDSVKEPRTLADGSLYFEPATITGLALALGTNRETLCNYQKDDEFFDTISTAKLRVEHYAEKQLYIGKSATGPIFALKNFGWTDQQNLNIGGQGEANPLQSKVTVEFVESAKTDSDT